MRNKDASGTRPRNPWPWITVGWCALLYWMSSGPVNAPGMGLPGVDKVAHGVAYAILAVLATLSLERDWRHWSPAALRWLPVLFTAVYGLSDEAHQYFVASRQADLLDWLADAVGGLAGGILMTQTRHFRFAVGVGGRLPILAAAREGAPDHD
ncbi:MAG TPA: VanZ family protein [Candidatus Hydrogenedentes bacterium]|nr:VanZ family protein [Candidatus Hydrogenedentota bacterium]HOV61738.1 VanZ family protein [Candidatus Hydrogenedentota bacterium]